MRRISSWLTLLAILLFSATSAIAAPSTQPQKVISSIVIQLANGKNIADLQAVSPLKVEHAKALPKADSHGRLSIPVPTGITADEFARSIANKYGTAIRYVEPIVEVSAPYSVENQNQVANAPIPNDPFYQDGEQYNPGMVNAPAAWNVQTDISVKIGVADSGYDASHIEAFPATCRDFTLNPTTDGPCTDPNGHGTHVTTTICAKTNNGAGIAGLAWQCPQLYEARVLDEYGNGNTLRLAEGIDWLTDQGVRVINLSLGAHYGSVYQSQVLLDAINRAQAAGIVIIAAAGNDGTDQGYNAPAQFDGVIAVAAVDGAGNLANYSNYGSWIDIAAPGNFIWAAYKGQMASLTGTSMATPHVSAAVSLLLSKSPCMTPQEVRQALRDSAAPLSDPRLGAGLVDFATLLEHAKPCNVSDTTPPTVTVKSPSAGETNVPLNTTVQVTFSEEMQSVNAQTFTLTDAVGNQITASVDYNASTHSATLTPATRLDNIQTYTAHVTSGAKDLAGNALVLTEWSFTTKPVSLPGTTPKVWVAIAAR